MPQNAGKPLALVLMGSDSDLPVMEGCLAVLKEFGVPFHVEFCSAHRTPERAAELASGAASAGFKVIIAAAGAAAHLAGVLASHTTLPVIGVPCPSALDGLDSLLSTVQMPAGVPVATVAIGKAGGVNSALLAVRILALSDDSLAAALEGYRAKLKEKVAAKNEALKKKLGL
ncbi:MAG: 5-(carboxyamino)imidazole ribonucleotide mutase [Planctomycetota bacterium]|nr:MAG: 5-(carboxyamino)imidazole ribonucleotide mutase [Planctomycetota bacterium]